jgi:hypothetical protein
MTVMTLKDVQHPNEILNPLHVKHCLRNLIELNEHKQQQQLLHPLTNIGNDIFCKYSKLVLRPHLS